MEVADAAGLVDELVDMDVVVTISSSDLHEEFSRPVKATQGTAYVYIK